MASPRLWFLYPLLYREAAVLSSRVAARATGPRTMAGTASSHNPGRRPRRIDNTPRRSFSCSTVRAKSEIPQRYGTANQPPAHLGGGKTAVHRDAGRGKSQESEDKQTVKEAQKALPEPQTDMQATPGQTGKEAASSLFSTVQTPENEQTLAANTNIDNYASSSAAQSNKLPNATVVKSSGQEALSTILAMPPPMSEESQDTDKPPHLQTPRHVHHFDTHTIVKNLHEGKWTEEQAIDVMKAVRVILADKMELAREGLLSKADAEMETYLFNAACAELRTEIKTSRSSLLNTLRSERNQLQHEVDILSQRITQETTTLKDEVKGMFDDRKMAVRIERRTMDNEIQALNNKISIVLNSEMRSEAEALRWVITRRTVLALVVIVIMTLIALRGAKYMEDNQERERKAFAHYANGNIDDYGNGRNGGGSNERGTQDMANRVEPGDSPGLVSLG